VGGKGDHSLIMPFDLENLKLELIRDEGEVPYAYQDSLGYWTIGVGHLIDKRKGGSIPASVSDLLLELDIAAKEADLDANLPWWRKLDDVRQRVMMNMAFNMGVGTLLTFHNTLTAIQGAQWQAAAQGMRNSLWYKQVGARAERLAQAMETGLM
jgi:lysozyme